MALANRNAPTLAQLSRVIRRGRTIFLRKRSTECTEHFHSACRERTCCCWCHPSRLIRNFRGR